MSCENKWKQTLGFGEYQTIIGWWHCPGHYLMYCQGLTKELYFYSEKINNRLIVNWRITEMNKLMAKKP